MRLDSIVRYVAGLKREFETRYEMSPNALIVGMLDLIFIKKAIIEYYGSVVKDPGVKDSQLGGLILISTTNASQEPQVCLL